MSTNTNKPARLLKAIEEQILFLIPTAVVTHSFIATPGATYGDEYLTVAFSGQNHLILCNAEAAPASGLTDGLGLTQRVYTPDVIRLGLDIGAGLADADTALAHGILTAVCASKNTRFAYHQKAAIAIAELVAGDATEIWGASFGEYGVFGYMGNQ